MTTQQATAEETSVDVNRRASERGESRLFIGGELVPARSGEEFENHAPATGARLGVTAAAGTQDMDAAISAARSAFDAEVWSRDRALRKRCLLQLQEALEAERAEIADELMSEVGAPRMTMDIAQLNWPLLDALTYPADLIDTFAWERDLGPGAVSDARNKRLAVKEPVGVVAAIAPWNFPLEINLNKLGQALATGNTVVLKPDPNTPWNATRLGRLIAEKTDFPAGVVNVVPTPDNAVAQQLVTDPRVDLVSFTGSTAVGQLIARLSADRVTNTFLELGGKSAMVILPDADIDSAIINSMQVCVHAGQGCAINTRLLVHRSQYERATELVAGLYQSIQPGDPASPGTLLGPVINPKQHERILGYIERARQAGGEIVTGGGAPTDLPAHLQGGTYVESTLIRGLDNSAEAAQDEIFGPVMVLLAYDDVDEALAIANDSRYGLSGSVFAGSAETGLDFARRMRTGSVMVNGGMFYGADAPYGGYKQSGVGRQNGVEGFEQYLETKIIGYH
ncbi:aldehyde dehydrogenase family protein [uncultured Williamsia sp.]|uniref:aldehyde dehydrogenase family protein n=1 Tax=uncultured Williamsia sp. TaxID=259311 RepID=UPI00262EE546|nr:aldehyde dehydrogenase family protein [uncultured Williamsia sp.]